MKKDLWLKILIPCLLFGIFVFFVYADPDFHPPISTARFARACAEADFPLQDTTEEYRAEFFKEVLTYNEASVEISFCDFSHDAYAKAYYTLFLNWLQNGNPGEVIRTTSDLCRFYISDDQGICFLYRNNTEVIYMYAPKENAEALDAIIQKLKL